MKKTVSAIMLATMISFGTTTPQVAQASEAPGIVAIVLGAVVAMSAITALNNTTNGDRAYYARQGVLDLQKDSMDYLATREVSPSLAKAYEFTRARGGETLSLDQYAETFVAHSDEIEAAAVEAAQKN